MLALHTLELVHYNDLGSAIKNSGSAFTGGSNDSNTFTVLNGTGAVDSDLTVRNLGTLLTFGTLNITVS